MALDARVRYTKRVIRDSFIQHFRTIFLHVLYDIRKDIDLYSVLFSRHSGSPILEQYCAMSLRKAENVLREQSSGTSDIQNRWASHYVTYGYMGIIQCWIEDGLRQTPEEVADCASSLLAKSLGQSSSL